PSYVGTPIRENKHQNEQRTKNHADTRGCFREHPKDPHNCSDARNERKLMRSFGTYLLLELPSARKGLYEQSRGSRRAGLPKPKSLCLFWTSCRAAQYRGGALVVRSVRRRIRPSRHEGPPAFHTQRGSVGINEIPSSEVHGGIHREEYCALCRPERLARNPSLNASALWLPRLRTAVRSPSRKSTDFKNERL